MTKVKQVNLGDFVEYEILDHKRLSNGTYYRIEYASGNVFWIERNDGFGRSIYFYPNNVLYNELEKVHEQTEAMKDAQD